MPPLVVQSQQPTQSRALVTLKPETQMALAKETGLTERQVQVIADTYAKGCNEPELWLFFTTARKRGLDPLAGQIHAVKRWSPRDQREVLAIQTGIDGYRLIASRTGAYLGRVGPMWKAKGQPWTDIWEEDEPPFAAKVGVLRKGTAEPIWAVVKYSEFVQTTKEGRPNAMWSKMPAHMLAKCAEAGALRIAFPQELSGIEAEEDLTAEDHAANSEYAVEMRAREEAMPATERVGKRYWKQEPQAMAEKKAGAQAMEDAGVVEPRVIEGVAEVISEQEEGEPTEQEPPEDALTPAPERLMAVIRQAYADIQQMPTLEWSDGKRSQEFNTLAGALAARAKMSREGVTALLAALHCLTTGESADQGDEEAATQADPRFFAWVRADAKRLPMLKEIADWWRLTVE